jgi:hypothetical protein
VTAEPIASVEEIVNSPAWLPLEAGADGSVALVRLDEAAYHAASFLDRRLLEAGYAESSCTLRVIETAAARLSPPASYIFHISHVGSTLISRLIGMHPNLFALREPALLRTIATATGEEGGALRLETALALLGRTWRSGQRAVVKVTSFVSELAAGVLAGNPRPTAIFMFAQPLSFLCGIFAGAASRSETRRLAPARLERLRRRLALPELRIDPSSEGELIAMTWACEMSALRQAADRSPAQVLWVDFDAFLAEPLAQLTAIFRVLGESPRLEEIERLLGGPVMRQYSKAPEHAYDGALRRALLLEARREHAAEIGRGIEWLQQLSARHLAARRLLA